MALDEPRNDDEVIDEQGTRFVIEKDLFNQVQPISIDFITTPQGSGFKLDSRLPKGDGCGSCSC